MVSAELRVIKRHQAAYESGSAFLGWLPPRCSSGADQLGAILRNVELPGGIRISYGRSPQFASVDQSLNLLLGLSEQDRRSL